MLLDVCQRKIRITKLLNAAVRTISKKKQISLLIKAAHLGSEETQDKVNSFFADPSENQLLFNTPFEKKVEMWRKRDYGIPIIELSKEYSDDPSIIYKIYQYAVNLNCVTAQSHLGSIYLAGQGVSKDAIAAAKWYLKAAKQGYASTQNNLALMLERGQGAEKDEIEASKLYKKAARQGHYKAQYNLALMYISQQKRSLDQDDKDYQNLTPKIIYWLKESSAQRNTDAMLILSLYYYKINCLEDALFWL